MRADSRPRTRLGAAALTASALIASACGTSAPAATAGAAKPAAPAVRFAAHAGLAKALRALESSYDGRIGAVAIDLGTGKAVGYRAHGRFPFNSMFKVYACAAVMRKARDTDPGLLDRVVRWKPEEVLENSPETKEYTDTGMTPAQLCRAGITKSDGLAGNMLLRQIGGPAGLTRYFRSLGDGVSRLDRYEPYLTGWAPGEKPDTTTPAAAAGSFSRITTGDALDARDRRRLVGWLRGSLSGTKRIKAGLPPTWTVGDKTGTGGASNFGTANDTAIVWPPGATRPIIMSVLTNRNAKVPHDDKVIADTATELAEALGRLGA
ncbi:class A beta-lactamase [Spirillospora sp. NPDC029432]|uniref:class A beta-lactamase n=1 Tax=Spirillospora sp. NPDC029432 TaxID=3154599 RepID=UPI0034528F9B